MMVLRSIPLAVMTHLQSTFATNAGWLPFDSRLCEKRQGQYARALHHKHKRQAQLPGCFFLLPGWLGPAQGAAIDVSARLLTETLSARVCRLNSGLLPLPFFC